MRGLADLQTPHPLGSHLPGIYQEDDLFLRFVSAFDVALAPILSTLDNLAAYLDPQLAPDDFVDWLAGWVGFALDERWSLARRREFVRHAVRLYRRRGTVSGLKHQVAIFSGGEVEVIESGGAAWSRTPGGSWPGSAEPGLLVRVHVVPPHDIDIDRLDALVAAAKPAHLPHRVEVVERR
jgi:phage tail-like protein